MVRKQQPGAKGAGKSRKAYDAAGNLDRGKLKANRKRLGETADGRTKKMKQERRGTFP